ncbi:MAG: hypothetical protein A2175_02050 [Candidatus Nealsonbacteria bacterium RBG_13_42_11]|uniref:DUF1648 domain-containing protein n=1 Tax=Candidatus Nealsonbacteria bacterium RBG_13_42_11 TaxID=1801663 RepID=A0A1G2E092_9BACT|nr:MAG: hypothetical protein A2175_02050 [Candidatus Nealsonbacteria bacterium RBG_13_42_11]
MKIFTAKEILPFSLIVFIFAVGVLLYPILPDRIPSHWNINGEIDAWSSKCFMVLLIPGITLLIYLLMIFLPLIDPLKLNYQKFIMPYFWLRTVFVLFFVLLYLYTLLAALGVEMINIRYFIVPVLSVMFIVIGLLLPSIKKNYFVGIRTPWTIHSEEVWDKTHQKSGQLFILAGIVSLVGVFMPQYSFPILITAILLASLSSVAYSYFVFKQIKGRE